ncbi:MAG: hypothetical protein LQ342_008083 [Letrouitia transgressa]|nr:MAG: hypothetical protein LQ342_008083 [Letrouitia transgressa]
MTATVHSYTHFLERHALYKTEKPYTLRFTPPEGFLRANIKLERHNIIVRDIRSTQQQPSYEHDGLAIVELDTKMMYDDFDDEARIKNIYLREVADLLKSVLHAQHVQIFEHTVRKQHEIFPVSTGEPYRYNQPTSIAHVDTTSQWALAMAAQLNPDRIDQIKQHRVQCVNIWKPITGPVREWPLALCSAASIRPDRDCEPCDLVYPDYVVENRQVYHSSELDWLYVSEQMPNEAWMFSQSDTADKVGPVIHTACPLVGSDVETSERRESIEVRALVYHGGFDDLGSDKNF